MMSLTHGGRLTHCGHHVAAASAPAPSAGGNVWDGEEIEREGQNIVTGSDAADDWPGPMPPEVEALILETAEVIRELDDTALQELTPLFYQHGYEQLRISLRDLLTVLGHDPEVTHPE